MHWTCRCFAELQIINWKFNACEVVTLLIVGSRNACGKFLVNCWGEREGFGSGEILPPSLLRSISFDITRVVMVV